MMNELWSAVDRYLGDRVLAPDPALDAALEASAAAGLPAISVSPLQGRLLHLIARISGARRILEIGTLGGYSTIWLARALPADGTLITLEAEPKYAEVARSNIARAGVASLVDVRLGPALETLPRVAADMREPFDFIFIDADKPGTPDYFAWALKLSHRGTIVVVDNAIRRGAIADPACDDADTRGMRQFTDMLAAERRVVATVIQTVGLKGYDGFALALVTEDSR